MILNILLLLFLDTSKTVSSKEILEYKNYDKPITNLKFNFEKIQEKINFSDSVFVLSKTTKTDSYCEITNEKKITFKFNI